MTNFSQDGLLVQITTQEYLELLEFKIQALKEAQEKDSSWNYGIDELELHMEYVKHELYHKS